MASVYRRMYTLHCGAAQPWVLARGYQWAYIDQYHDYDTKL